MQADLEGVQRYLVVGSAACKTPNRRTWHKPRRPEEGACAERRRGALWTTTPSTPSGSGPSAILKSELTASKLLLRAGAKLLARGLPQPWTLEAAARGILARSELGFPLSIPPGSDVFLC